MESKIILKTSATYNWGKSGLLKSKEGLIVASNGGHNDHSFSGIVIYTPDDRWDLFELSDKWVKDLFTPVTTPLTIEFLP